MPAKINDAKMEEIIDYYLKHENEHEVEIARKFGISKSTLYRHTVKAGVKRPAVIDKRRKIIWTEEMYDALKTMKVKDFCKHYGVGVISTVNKRKELGITSRIVSYEAQRPYEYIDTTVYQWPRSKALANHIKELRA